MCCGKRASASPLEQRVGMDRLKNISTLRQEVSAISSPYVQRLVELKNAPVGDNPLAQIRQLQGVADELMNS